jgi:hypothetical protein
LVGEIFSRMVGWTIVDWFSDLVAIEHWPSQWHTKREREPGNEREAGGKGETDACRCEAVTIGG